MAGVSKVVKSEFDNVAICASSLDRKVSNKHLDCRNVVEVFRAVRINASVPQRWTDLNGLLIPKVFMCQSADFENVNLGQPGILASVARTDLSGRQNRQTYDSVEMHMMLYSRTIDQNPAPVVLERSTLCIYLSTVCFQIIASL